MSLKMLREDVCRHFPEDFPEHVVWLMSQLIDEIDRHRPLGPDGKHGNLHTPTCGCEESESNYQEKP